jgi:serine O-acetyltransferase
MKADFNPSVRRQEIKEKILEYDTLSLFTMIKSDIAAHKGWKKAFIRAGFWVVLGYRIAHKLYKYHLDWFAKCFQLIIAFFTGCEISRKAVFGPGLRIYHPKDIFVGPHVYMGEKCILGPHIFLASNLDPFDPDDYPVIDDRLIIAVGGVILGGITLGTRVQIGPNAVVIKDIPDNYNVMPSPTRAFPRGGWKGKVR